ncbi:MAG: hypothetical protein KGR16_02865 [Verrucomicrobia bacterium]|nr:hypothetical protein [Verrucomicrobiota bacterium]MDE3047869.1 hypothetical protein [Verrucomicrobiota bacterium]
MKQVDNQFFPWQILKRIGSVRVTVDPNERLGWGGVGQASVLVCEDDRGRILFEERGVWESGPHAGSSFFNHYRWELREDLLSLEHLRQGPERGVLLYRWRVSADSAELLSPHVCGADLYKGHLSWDATALSLICQVQGERKNGRVHSLYLFHGSRKER